MKFVTIESEGTQRAGVRLEEGVLDLQKALVIVPNEFVTTDVMDIIEKYEFVKPILSSYINDPNLNKNIDKERYMLREDQVVYLITYSIPLR
jgi:hypothetical protein